ncbi:MAG: adenosine deaminase [Gammaproteobacteria bacterium]|nr:adenosine deaminase [Gammaproteobacteria bacterium]
MIEETIEFARNAHKAELHMHLEGALTPELFLKFATRNNKDIPYKTVEEIREKYLFTNLEDFINVYIEGFQSLATTQDYNELFDDYCEHAVSDNVVHTEIFTEAQGVPMIGMELPDMMDACVDGIERWSKKGLEILLIPTFLRHLSEREALESLDLLEPYYKHISAIGLAAVELGHPPNKFKALFAKARELGFKLVAHAGEEGPPEYVWQAIDELGVDRIDHGNRAIEDPVLVARLARDQIPLTMCPLSNLCLCVVDSLEEHQAKRFLDAGVKVTINSDDPAYFGGYINDNFEQIIRAQQLDLSDVEQLITNSLESAFSPA